MSLSLESLLQQGDRFIVELQESRDVLLVGKGMVISRESHNPVQKSVILVNNGDLEEGCLQEVTSVVLEPVVVIAHTFAMILEIGFDVPW